MKNDEIKQINAWDNGDEYAFWTENPTEFSIPKIYHEIRPKTNQAMNEDSKSACTIFGVWNQIIRLFWLDLTMEEENKIWLVIIEYCKQFWYVPGKGWSTPTAVDAVRKWWNEIWYKQFKNTEQIFSYRAIRGDAKIKEAQKNWHLIGFTYQLNRNNDRYAGMVDKDIYPMVEEFDFERAALSRFLRSDESVIKLIKMMEDEFYIAEIAGYLKTDESRIYVIEEVLSDEIYKAEIAADLDDLTFLKGINWIDKVFNELDLEKINSKTDQIFLIKGITEQEKKEIVLRMVKKNKLALKNIDPRFLESKYLNTLGEDKINQIICYPEIQNKILFMSLVGCTGF